MTELDQQHSVARESLRAVLGLLGTLAGAQLLVVNASDIANRLGVAQVVIGVTLVAVGTSLPELVTAVQAQRRRESDLVVGNLLGSNLFNALAGGGVIGLLARPGGQVGVTTLMLAAMVAVMLLAWYFLSRGGRVTRSNGAVLVLAYLATLPLLAAGT